MANTEYTNLNQIVGRWLERTLWIWLPFHALIRLTKDVIAKHSQEEK
jgi:hypothetical protein